MPTMLPKRSKRSECYIWLNQKPEDSVKYFFQFALLCFSAYAGATILHFLRTSYGEFALIDIFLGLVIILIIRAVLYGFILYLSLVGKIMMEGYSKGPRDYLKENHMSKKAYLVINLIALFVMM